MNCNICSFFHIKPGFLTEIKIPHALVFRRRSVKRKVKFVFNTAIRLTI